jgi:predicted outer membrane repeat protein
MATFTVTTLADETFEGSETSGAPNGAGLSLREALALANGNGEADEITFAAGLAGGTLFLQSGELAITTDGITVDGDIDGDGDADITIDADSAAGLDDAASRVFVIDGAGTGTIAAALNGLVIRDGNAGAGAGIWVGAADAMTLTNATVSGNRASVSGGGIFGLFDSSIVLTNVTVSGNSAGESGGGIFGHEASSIVLTNATVSGNSATYSGGGIYGFFNNPITLINSTVTGNNVILSNGGGLYSFGSSAVTTLGNSIVAGNNAELGDDLFGGGSTVLVFAGGNVIGSAPANFASQSGAPTAQIDGTSQAALETVFAAVANNPTTNVLSGVLADNGGRVPTIALNPDATNPAIDTGTGTLPADTHDLDGDGNTTEALPVDARGFARDVDFDGTPPTPDLGAFEQQNTPSLVVTTLDDELDAADTDLATVNLTDLSLREALALANGDAGANTITFAAALSGGTLFLTTGQELAITTDGITVDGDIDGDGDADITIDADSAAGLDDAASRVFLINDGGAGTIAATLNGLVIRDGNATDPFTNRAGGGIYVGDFDALTLTNATVSGNSAGGDGGGIGGDYRAAITLTNATVSGNSAGADGGGIGGGYGAAITLTNATVSGNSAGEHGGGIYSYGASTTTTLTNSIVAGNAAAGLGDDLFGGDTEPANQADLVFTGGNIIGSTPSYFATVNGAPTATINGTSQAALETVFAAVANNPTTNVLSGVLADNGGGVQTIALNSDATNPAIDTGTGTLPADTHDLDGDGNTAEALPVDARGLPRTALGVADIGAFEVQTITSLVVTTLDDELDGADTNPATADG